MRLLTYKKTFLLLVVLAFSLEAKMITRTQIIMGTYITISLEEKNQHYLEDGFNIFKEVDAQLSSYKENADIYKLNLDKHTLLHPYSYEALVLSKKYYSHTAGYFDISVGSITKDAYAFGEDEKVPTKQELLDSKIDFYGLVFDTRQASIKENMKLDLGGMGKGFAVDKVTALFEDKNITKAIIAASGDIRCLDTCKLDIQNPFKDGVFASFRIVKKNMGISTSGNYNRYIKSVENNHLINPKSKASQDKFVSITLISSMPSSDLDAYATASSVMPKEKAYAFLDSLDLAYIILESDFSLRVSKNINKFTKDLFFENACKK